MASKAACRSGGAGPEGAESLNRTADSVEPLCYHGLPRLFWEDVIHAYDVKAVLDLTAGPATCAEAALNLRVPYYGLCQTFQHLATIKKHLTKRMWEYMKDPENPHYEQGLTESLKKEAPKKDPKKKPGPKKKDPKKTGGVGTEDAVSELQKKIKAIQNAQTENGKGDGEDEDEDAEDSNGE